jgi:hypothetical protein
MSAGPASELGLYMIRNEPNTLHMYVYMYVYVSLLFLMKLDHDSLVL